MNDLRANELAVIQLVSVMSKSSKLELLRDLVQNMVERADPEEIADFILAQLGGDAVKVTSSYYMDGKD
jgi:hypothetical protein